MTCTEPYRIRDVFCIRISDAECGDLPSSRLLRLIDDPKFARVFLANLIRDAKRPRVAAIGLDDAQVASITPLCGEVRPAHNLSQYLKGFSWTETDLVVACVLRNVTVDAGVNLLAIGGFSFRWSDSGGSPPNSHYAFTSTENTERELSVTDQCPAIYRQLTGELSQQLSRAEAPPVVLATSRRVGEVLVATTSRAPVALQLVLPARSDATDTDSPKPIALLLPRTTDLAAWFRAFLADVHESDPTSVPQAPPRLNQPADWYTPDERVLADRLSAIEQEVERLRDEQDEVKAELSDEGERADAGIRRALWAGGNELVEAVAKIFRHLGFTVRDMDAGIKEGEPKREDLRLTLRNVLGWEAVVEVKGYTSGVKTNDARQIRQHREGFLKEEGRLPDLTVWLSNPHRTLDPSSRPGPDGNVQEAADNIGAVHVLATDLYKQWALVAAGNLEPEVVVRSLMDAAPGLWIPPPCDSTS